MLTTGRLTLTNLGVRELVIEMPKRHLVQTPAISFRLPSDALQGDGRWYVMNLHFALEFAANSGAGLVDVSGATDGRATDLDEVATTRRNGRLHLAWNQVGLIDGRREGEVVGHRLELTDRNVMVRAGVQPGVNTLQFQLEQYGGARVARLVIFGDSGIEASALGPGVLVLQIRAHPGPVLYVGQILRVTLRLVDRGKRPVRRVTLGVTYPASSVHLLAGGKSTEVYEVGRHPYARTYLLKAVAAGRPRISFNVDSVNGNPEADLTPAILPRQSSGITLWIAVGLGALGGLLIAAGRAVRRRH